MDIVTRKEMEDLLRDITQQALGYRLNDDQLPDNLLSMIIEWYKCGTDEIRKQISRRLRNES